MHALRAYRSRFRPSETLDRPYAMIGVNVFAAGDEAEGRRLFTSLQQQFLELRRTGDAPALGPPVDDLEERLSPMERSLLEHALACSFAGSAETIRHGLQELIASTNADEVIVAGQIYDHQARLRSFEITAGIRDALG
jgi:alkanesulfonate monooxygenase SsuD/methylene tetrahydromethanopterin reductase-like flavin-dependent oxidoreductase (luciferase family)